MTQSMTGFASSSIEVTVSKQEKLSLLVSIKTLNSRYFEMTCKLPYLFNNLEVTLHRHFKKIFERGHVYLTIKIQHDGINHEVVPALKIIEQYLKAINTIKTTYKIQQDVGLENILQLPNVLQVEETELHEATEEKIIKAILSVADQLIESRKSEGLVLEKDILNCMKMVSKDLVVIKKHSAKAILKKRKELEAVLASLQKFEEGNLSVDKVIFEQQRNILVGELEKIDIHEEIVRACSHLKNIQELMQDGSSSKGKKLDFTLQELNREINTIASKCSDSSISALTINVKSETEKAREQAQNII